ncbi:MAG: rod shape-determining protein MreD [Deltaproteobacteria bacterium]|jgi:rod shape-determining protein MreD|nr:MAG: rod shape-determining protein MreD [Deltaproteobacteria bacterium]
MFFLFLLGCVLLILETTLFYHLPLWKLKIDGLLLLIIYVSLYLNGIQSGLLIFSLGILVDTFAGSALGMHVLVYALLFLLVKVISRNLVIKNIYYQMATIFSVSFLANLGLLVLDLVFMDGVIRWYQIGMVFLQSLLTSLLSPIFFICYDYFDRLFGLREAHEVSR